MGKFFSFGARLKAMREGKSLTQQQLADAAGFSREFISRLEKDRQEPSWGSVQKLASALGISCEAFNEPPPADVKPAKKPKR